MTKSLLEQLPDIIAKGRQEAEKILEHLESRHRVGLQTHEWVLPAKESLVSDWISKQEREQAYKIQAVGQSGFSSAQASLYPINLKSLY